MLGNSTAMQFGVAIREDSIVEEAENFSVRVELQEGGSAGVLIGRRREAVVVIEDNDGTCTHVLKPNLIPRPTKSLGMRLSETPLNEQP